MKFEDLITHHLSGTALDYASVKDFLSTPPHYYQWGIQHEIDQTALTQLNATDLFEFYLRFYLTGRHKTLQAVLREAREFVHQDANAAPYFIGYSLENIRQRLLILEWYELLPRLETARKQISALTPPETIDQRPPRVIRFLDETYI